MWGMGQGCFLFCFANDYLIVKEPFVGKTPFSWNSLGWKSIDQCVWVGFGLSLVPLMCMYVLFALTML